MSHSARRHRPYGRWTPQVRADFLSRLARSGNVSAAAAACGLSRQAAYDLRTRDPVFAGAWDAQFAEPDAGLAQRLDQRLDQAPRNEAEARFLRLLQRICPRSGEGEEIFSRAPSTDQPL